MPLVETADAFIDMISRSGLLPPEALAPFVAADPPGKPDDPPARRLAAWLVRERLLTASQATQLLRGKYRGFFLTDKYKLLDLIGVGGMGKVFLCEHLILQRLVAVKVLAGHGSAPPAAGVVERFYREARAVAALDSRYVVKVHDVDSARGQPFMVMEYVDGADLHRVVTAHGRLPVAAAAEYARQAALGLQAADEAGLVHRDVKPGNVLVDRTGAVKLLDLGLARFFADVGRNQNLTARFDGDGILGTAEFISPEQITHSSAVDIRSDLYSLGCTLYFLLAGRGPFDEGTAAQKLIWHQYRDPQPLVALRDDMPPDLAAVVSRLTAKKPDERYQTPADAAAALAPFAAGGPFAPPGPVMPKVPPGSYRLGLSKLPPPSGSGLAVTDSSAPLPLVPPPTPVRVGASPVSTDASGKAPTRRLPPASEPAPRATPISVSDIPITPLKVPPGARPIRVVAAAAALVAVVALVGYTVWPAKPADGPTVTQGVPPAPPPPLPSVVPAAAAVKSLTAGGSTFVAPMMARWAELYEAKAGVKFAYDAVGSGKGIDGALSGKYALGCTDAHLTDAQLAAAKAAGKEVRHVPLVLGAVVPTYNVPGLPPGSRLRFTGAVLAEIYLGRVTRWNDPAVAANNPEHKDRLPDLPIRVVYRSDSSGTTAIWTEYLSAVNSDWRVGPGQGTTVKWPVGEGAARSTGVTEAVNRTAGAIGYVEMSNAIQDGLPSGEVRNRAGRYVGPSLAGVTAAAAGAADRIADDMRYSLVDAPGEGSYPVCGTAWALVVYPAGGSADPDAVAFLEWATHTGQAHATDLRYAPLPPAMQLRLDGLFYRLKAKP